MSTHRRRISGRNKAIGAVAAAAVAAGGAFLFTNTALATDEAVPASPKAAGAGFAPYVDTSLSPAFDLMASAEATGVKEYTLAFVTDGGGCTPTWGGTGGLGDNPVA
ncbi:chitinase, partial [Streptomyces sp. SID4956]|nr:chitinase [Streptomyces sp. SID4956]